MSHKCAFGAIVCIDFRFRSKTSSFLENHFGTDKFDLFSWPGAAKKLADSATQATAIADVSVCIDKHNAERIVVISHTDCGAYDIDFESKTDEVRRLSQDLHTARNVLTEQFPSLSVELYLYDKDTNEFTTVN